MGVELKTLLDLAERTPFQRVIIELDNGRRVYVGHPEYVHFLPGRHRVSEILVHDELADRNVYFHWSAVSAIVPVKEDGEPPGGARL